MKKIASLLYRHPFWLLLLFLLIAYFPVLLPFFHLKNDILTQNLPTRFVFGESLYSGYEPFWNPFLHYGNPQYGDMNNGFWNPVQWLIGGTVGYNIYTITFEELFYILIGGFGIYKVSREFFNKDVALVTGMAYMCCGYITGHLQYLCWITATGYFPYVLLYFTRVNKNPIVKNFLLGGISVFLFVASSHPGLIIGSAYFFLFTLVVIYINRKSFLQHLYHRRFWLINLLFFLFSCILSIVVIVSNLDILPEISRGGRVSLEQALWAPTTIRSYISTLLPLPVHKSGFFQTDIGMRNVYIGLAHFIGILIFLRTFNRRIFLSFIIPLLFFILLSAGGFFKTFAWHTLPLIGYVRLNGEFTYFVILILLVGGAAGLQSWTGEHHDLRYRKIINWLMRIILIAAIGSIIILIAHTSFLYANITGNNSFKGLIKSIIDNCSFWDLFLIQAIIQVISLFFIRKWLASRKGLAIVLGCNLAIITWLTLPFTGLGMMSKRDVQAVINEFPRGIYAQELVSINNAKYIHPVDDQQFMLIASYSKKIGHPLPDQYPVQLNTNAAFISDSALFSFIKKQAFVFLSNDTTIQSVTNFDSANIKVENAGPGKISLVISNKDFKWLNLLQNNYKYWEVRIDGNPVTHYTGFKTFISVPIESGEHRVEFRFTPTPIKTAMWVNIVLLLLAILAVAIPGIASKRLFR